MYRHTQFNMMSRGSLPSPAPEEEELSDSDSEMIAELDRKRRQLDEEIASFKAQKEKEFRAFEQELRRKRTQRKRPSSKDLAKPPPTDPTVLNLLANTKPLTNGHNCPPHHTHDSKPPPPAKPTLAVEKVDATAITTPPAAATRGHSPHYSLSKSLSRSPPHSEISLTPPGSANGTPKSPTSPHDGFAGLFTPHYLPLLDSKSRPCSEPASPQSTADALRKSSTSSSLPTESPMTKAPFKRSATAPILPPNLTSALRTTSGNCRRKRKHVSFHLTDGSVVSPSSSFEQSSPDLPANESVVELNHIDETMGEAPWSWSKGESPLSPKNEIGGMRLEGDGDEEEGDGGGYFGHVSASANENGNTIPVGSVNGDLSPRGLQFVEADDGGSGVGFFELEEELEKEKNGTRPRSPKREKRGIFEELVDDDEEDGDKEKDGDENPEETRDKDRKGVDFREKTEGTRYGEFSAGSVPIDIIARSWVGSYGH